MKKRADVLLFEQGACESRSRAQALILAGRVRWRGERVDKAGTLLPDDAQLELEAPPRYVSRGGDKLAGALAAFAPELDLGGAVCLDVGASTGGFTDCLLQHGAAKVYAVDVGYGQLHARLRADARVVVRERVNARHLTAADFAEPLALAVVDASFIGLGKLVDALGRCLPRGAALVALVKPQFEAGRAAAARGRGVIRDPAEREAAIEQARAALREAGFAIVAETDSPLRGPKGNLERFVLARRN